MDQYSRQRDTGSDCVANSRREENNSGQKKFYGGGPPQIRIEDEY